MNDEGILDALVIVYSKKIDDPRRKRDENISSDRYARLEGEDCNAMYSNNAQLRCVIYCAVNNPDDPFGTRRSATR